ncbi:unnamed protein product [Linum tenue]|uniref:AB hydrolase-1 domain-containing protein n=1 Tax=Linum tenue TaxID=586396 RepID=A0AAV0NTV1_9ROSI|nr:unnamed protein product [Linum tenue]
MGSIRQAHNVKVLGAGDQVIVLAHGFGTDQSVWKHLVPHLVDEFKVIVYDNMGAGTTNPDYFDFNRYSGLEGYAYDLLAILEDLQVESCIFVGHSVSAMIGVIASISRPELFLKLILLAGSPRVFERCGVLRGIRARRPGPALPGDSVQLQVLVRRIRSLDCRRRHGVGGGTGIQPDAVQHAARYSPERRPDHLPERHEEYSPHGHRPLPHTPEHQGPRGAGGGVGVPEPAPGRGVHRGDHAVRRSPAAAELAGRSDPGAAPAHSL